MAQSLCRTYAGFFPIGAAVSTKTIQTHKKVLLEHFNSITAENQMKFVMVHPAKDRWNFQDADTIVDFAVENKMKIRGHTLVWHKQVPDWVFLDDRGNAVSRNILLGRMKEHITTVMQRYKGKVYCWDVVNEAVASEGSDWLRRSKWLEIVGQQYIAKAFEFAKQADSDALLFYNDYHCIFPEKREKIYKLIRYLLDTGVSIDGIGIQGHWNIYEPADDTLKETIERFASLNLQLQITELDLSVFAFDDSRDCKQPTKEMLRLQEQRYESIFRIFRQYRDVITGVTFWGIADDCTWLDNFPVKGRKDWPLLFDTEHRPKEALHKITNFTERR